MASLPPCRRSLVQHIRRVNHQVGIWKRSHVPEPQIPNPSPGHGWEETNGILDPLWFDGDVLPRVLADIAQVDTDNEDSDSDIDQDEEETGIESETDESDSYDE